MPFRRSISRPCTSTAAAGGWVDGRRRGARRGCELPVLRLCPTLRSMRAARLMGGAAAPHPNPSASRNCSPNSELRLVGRVVGCWLGACGGGRLCARRQPDAHAAPSSPSALPSPAPLPHSRVHQQLLGHAAADDARAARAAHRIAAHKPKRQLHDGNLQRRRWAVGRARGRPGGGAQSAGALALCPSPPLPGASIGIAPREWCRALRPTPSRERVAADHSPPPHPTYPNRTLPHSPWRHSCPPPRVRRARRRSPRLCTPCHTRARRLPPCWSYRGLHRGLQGAQACRQGHDWRVAACF